MFFLILKKLFISFKNKKSVYVKLMLQKILFELDSMIKSKIIYLFSINVDHIITNQNTYEIYPFKKINDENNINLVCCCIRK